MWTSYDPLTQKIKELLNEVGLFPGEAVMEKINQEIVTEIDAIQTEYDS